ncbi:RNA polymerase sigma factor [Flavobacterium faecale]|uniref:RNA polymerase sigma factor n=1 Tax=Flavobacterium faecale TaxID=1355330 RepID=UPI003AADC9B5
MESLNNIQRYNNLSDEELVLLISKIKDTVVFGYLYDRYEHLVFNKCYGFVHSIDEAKDLTQDVFLHVFIKLSSFKGKSRFSTWLYSVTYNFCVNYLNRDKERKMASQSKSIDKEYNLAIEISDYNLYQLQIKKIKKAMDEIPPEDKIVLQMKYQDDASIKELQEVMSLSESAVKMRISRAKVKLVEAYNRLE